MDFIKIFVLVIKKNSKRKIERNLREENPAAL